MGSQHEYTDTDEGYWQALFAEDEKLHPPHSRRPPPPHRTHDEAQTSPPPIAPPPEHDVERREAAAAPVLGRLHTGDVCDGTVTNLTAFGAFVDIGGFEGLVHVSEISWSRVSHPRDALRVGDTVKAFVITVSPDEGRLALSLKRCKPNPWETLADRYRVGQVVRGTVTNVVDFGAFVKVESDLEGMIHVSELADGHFLHPRNILREGMTVAARVIGVDGKQRRLALSLRGVEPRREP